jgi:antitoxin (DNA-binding transcriptional repressor) of toxin-antitoxin stability system
MKRAPLKLPPDTVGVADAKRDLIALIDRILHSGKPINIARRGKAVARLVPIEETIGSEWRKHLIFKDNDPFFADMEDIIAERESRKMRAHPAFPRR